MARNTEARCDRIELRALREEKRLLASAVAHERLDVTSFILSTVLPAAWEIGNRAERIVLSERDTARVLKLLEDPPKPTAALLAAAQRRRDGQHRAGQPGTVWRRPSVNRIVRGIHESRTLACHRDISSQLRIKDAEPSLKKAIA